MKFPELLELVLFEFKLIIYQLQAKELAEILFNFISEVTEDLLCVISPKASEQTNLDIGYFTIDVSELHGIVHISDAYPVKLKFERMGTKGLQVLVELRVDLGEVKVSTAKRLVVLSLKLLLLIDFKPHVFLEDLVVVIIRPYNLQVVEFLQIPFLVHLHLVLWPEILLYQFQPSQFLHSFEGS